MAIRTPIYGLNLVRFAAAIYVMVYHLRFEEFAGTSEAARLTGLPSILRSWWSITWFGWIGVQIFFVISGLVIAYSARGAQTLPFIVRRISRLLPTMLIAATYAALVEIFFYRSGVADVALRWAKSVTFFPFGPWIAGQIWTLPIEVFFFGIVALLILSGMRRRLDWLAWALALVSALYWFAIVAFEFVDPFSRATQLLALQHGCYFALGIALSGVARGGLNGERFALIGLCMLTAVAQIRQTAIWGTPHYGVETQWSTAYIAFVASMAFVGVSLYFRHAIAARIGSRSAGLLRTTGLMTYPLYLIHIHVAGPVILILSGIGMPIIPILLVAGLVSLVAAYFVAHILEPPLHRVIKTWLDWQIGKIQCHLHSGRTAVHRRTALIP